MDQFGALDGFTSLHVALAFCLSYISWDTQSDPPVDTSAIRSRFGHGLLAVFLHDGDFVAKKSRCFISGVSDERFFLRKL